MRRAEYYARVKAIRSKERTEFNILEAYVNASEWDPGPFGVYAKQVHFSVGTNDWDPPSRESALARVRHLSNKFWPK